MAARANAISIPGTEEWKLAKVEAFPRMRALAWQGNLLYASRGYTLLRTKIENDEFCDEWEPVASFRPAWWRTQSSSRSLSARLFRDGFHALVALSSGNIIAAVPGAIVAFAPGDVDFRVRHKVLRGTRPLHLTATPDDRVFWGEYFDNRNREEVHIYASSDRGENWNVAYTFPRGAIRHVHNIVYDEWANCLWILTGDQGSECRILRACPDLRSVETVFSGNQQTRSAALVPTRDAVYFSSDTPSEQNHVHRLDRSGTLTAVAPLGSSSIYGCRVGDSIFFSTMVEPSSVNWERNVCILGSRDGLSAWQKLLQWPKDCWPMSLFQYGNAFLPNGSNATGLLAVSSIAVDGADGQASLWRV
jgi:hypothetical protein